MGIGIQLYFFVTEFVITNSQHLTLSSLLIISLINLSLRGWRIDVKSPVLILCFIDRSTGSHFVIHCTFTADGFPTSSWSFAWHKALDSASYDVCTFCVTRAICSQTQIIIEQPSYTTLLRIFFSTSAQQLVTRTVPLLCCIWKFTIY